MKTILVPTDFSPNAKKALLYAVELAKKGGEKIILFHANHFAYLNFDVSQTTLVEQNISLEKKVVKQLTDLSNKISKEHDIVCEAVHKQGLFMDVLTDVVKKHKVDLIVMGTKGKAAVENVLMGSNTANIIGKVNCPIIAVPEKSRHKALKKIVFATDYKSTDTKSLELLIEIATPTNAHIDVIHIASDEYSEIEELDHLNKFELKVLKKNTYENISYKLLNGVEIDRELELYIKRESICLIGITNQHRTFIQKIFGKRSVTKKLLYHTGIPLIAFYQKK